MPAQAQVQLQDVRTISHAWMRYIGWPTVGRCRDGRLLAVASAGRTRHVCPFGQVQIIESRDDGESWTRPRVLVDGLIDDRDAGVLETAKGTILVNWFTSLAWEVSLADEAFVQKLDAEQLAEWKRRSAPLTDALRRQEMGCWMIRSTDGGATWSPRIATVANSPHGPMQLSDGRLLYPGRRLNPKGEFPYGGPFNEEVGASVSEDDGQTWRWLSHIPPMPGHSTHQYHELHGVEAADGRIVVHIRNHNEPHKFETLQTESADGGRSWSVPRTLGFYGYPNHLLRLRDGRLISTFGRRQDPKGNQIVVSDDHGRTWSKPVSINVDSAGDLGYPSTVQLDDGSLLSVWYDTLEGGTTTVLRQARWRLV